MGSKSEADLAASPRNNGYFQGPNHWRTMKNAFTTLLCLFTLHFAAHAQPTDPFGDAVPVSTGYESNDGQLIGTNGSPVPEIKFLSEGVGTQSYFAKGTVSFVTVRSNLDTLTPDTITPPDTLYRVDMTFVGGETVAPQASSAYADYRNYYLAHTMPHGVENVFRYRYLLYQGIQPGIDLWLYGGPAGQKYAFVCAPGSDPTRLKLHFDGQSSLGVASDGSLRVGADLYPIRLPQAQAFEINGSTLTPKNWVPNYTIGTDVTFQIGTYDTTKELLIFIGESMHAPPGGGIEGICWSTYFGGNKYDWIDESEKDVDDNYYVSGRTQSTILTFPQTPGNQIITPGLRSAFVSKFSATEVLLWTALLGASGGSSTYSHGLTIREGPVRWIYMGGLTTGNGLFTQAVGGAYLDATTAAGSYPSFIAKFSNNGAIAWSTYWGNGLTNIQGLAISASRLVVVGGTQDVLPVPPTPLPPPATVYPQNSTPGTSDAFACMFGVSDNLIWLTYLGGSNNESCMDVRAMGNDFIVYGNTQSNNFPTLSLIAGAYMDASYNGQYDTFLGHFSVQAQHLWSTYFGSNNQEEAGLNGLAVSPYNKDIYIVGQTQGINNNLPITWQLPQSYHDNVANTGRNGFIARFAGGSHALQWSTFFGSHTYFHFLPTVTVDEEGFAFVGGSTRDTQIPLLPSTYYLFNESTIFPNATIPCDGFVTMFKPAVDVQLWCTYFGGEAGPTDERINTLCAKEHSLFGAGMTSKWNNVNSYFPLEPSTNPNAYFDNSYNDISSYPADGFMTKFCSLYSKAMIPLDVDVPANASHLFYLANGWFRLIGSGTGSSIDIYDASGRLCASAPVSWTGEGTTPFHVSGLSPGSYVISAQGIRAVKLVIVE